MTMMPEPPTTSPASPAPTPPVALSVAASDSGGGAGVQADLRTFAAHGVAGASVLTAVTAQNTLGIRSVEIVSPAMVAAQLDAVLDDLPVAAVKTGALGGSPVIDLLLERADRLPALVVDPVLLSSSGQPLYTGDYLRSYRELLPYALMVTPNLAEAGVLLGRSPRTLEDAVEAAAELGALGTPWVLVTGGHLAADPVDILWHAGRTELLHGTRVVTRNDHGTGCTVSSAITARLALGEPPDAAVRAAREYVHQGLLGAAGWHLGAGSGPLAWPVPPLPPAPPRVGPPAAP